MFSINAMGKFAKTPNQNKVKYDIELEKIQREIIKSAQQIKAGPLTFIL